MPATGWTISRVGFGGDDYGNWKPYERYNHVTAAVATSRRNVVRVDGDAMAAFAAERAANVRRFQASTRNHLWQARGAPPTTTTR